MKCSYNYDDNVLEAFHKWAGDVRLRFNDAASLALWLVMGTDAATRGECFRRIDAGELLSAGDIQVAPAKATPSPAEQLPEAPAGEPGQSVRRRLAQPESPAAPQRRRRAGR